MYQIIKNPTDIKYQDGNRLWQGIPGIAKAKNGRLWAVWYSGGVSEGNYNWPILYTSTDDGKSWEGPKLTIDSQCELRAFDTNLWLDPDGNMWLFWHQNDEGWNCKFSIWAMKSENPEDPDPDWSEPRRIANGVALNDPTVLKDGSWLLPTTVWNIVNDERLGTENNAGCYISRDKGETWEYCGGIAELHGERDHEENMIVELEDGRLRMLMRCKDGIAESYSEDKGKTWTDGYLTDLTKTNARFAYKKLESGRTLLVYYNPPVLEKSRTHLTAALSDDDGKTWSYKLELDSRFEVSYPDVQQDEEGNIYVIYDCNRWSSMEILLAKITEQDVMAGEIVSETSFLRRLVNNNGGVEPQQIDFLYSADIPMCFENMAECEVQNAQIKPISRGEKMFSDAEYIFSNDLPSALADKKFWLSNLDATGNTVTALSDGDVYILTYVDGVPPIQRLRDQGLRTQVTIPRYRVCSNFEMPFALMSKSVKKGDTIALTEWAIVLGK